MIHVLGVLMYLTTWLALMYLGSQWERHLELRRVREATRRAEAEVLELAYQAELEMRYLMHVARQRR